MATLHPFFVHFPIALLFAAALFDAYGAMRKRQDIHFVAYVLQLGSALLAMLAGFSGNLAENAIAATPSLSGGIQESLESHVGLGNALVWVIVIFAVGRTFALLEKKPWAQSGWVFPLLSLTLALLVIYTGLLGGELTASILDFYKQN